MSETMKTDLASSGPRLTRRDFGLLAGVVSTSFAAGSSLAQARRGGVANVATVGEPPTLDPMDSPADVVGMISQHMFETLYTWGAGWRIRPLLAAAEPQISADGRVYTIPLRQNVRFHDGTTMTSADVLASLNRWMTVAQRGKQTKEFVESVSAPDKATVRIALVKPFAPLLSFLSLQTSAAIIIPESNQAHPMKTFIGTGPFRFVERMADRYVQLRRFDDYTPRDDEPDNYGGRRTAWLDEVRFVPVPDASTRLQGAIAGQFDYVDALPVENAPQLKGTKAEAVIFKSFGWPFFFINAKQGPLTNVALRRAVLAALNFEDMLAAAFGSTDFYQTDAAWYPAGFAMHSDAGAEVYKKAGDAERAKKMAQEAGYKGEPIRILTSRQFDFHYKMAQVAAEYLRAAGFAADLVVVDWATLLTRRGDASLYEIFITHGPILPEPTLFSFMTPTAPGWWATPRRDAVINAFNSEPDPEKRAKLWGDVQLAIYEEVPVMRIGNFNMLAARAQRLQGLTPAVWPFFWKHVRLRVSKPRGFALVGAGLFGERHAQAYQRHPAADFVAVCDLDEARARRLAETYGAGRWTSDLTSVLDDPSVHAVSIATPDHAHRDVAVAAAAAGKHILVEKPLATTVEDAEAIVAAADAAGVTLMVDFHNRLNPPMVAARQAVERGDIGLPTYVYARLSNTIAVPQDMLRWSGNSSALWFLGSHMVDIVGWILDDRPSRCYVVSREGVLKSKGIEAPDFHVGIVEYAKGAVVVYEHAWILPRTHATVKDLKVEILGSSGALYVDGSHNRTFELYTADKGTFPDMMVPPFGPRLTGFVLDAVAHFIEAVTEGKPVLATGRDGLDNVRTVAAMIAAADTGQAVVL